MADTAYEWDHANRARLAEASAVIMKESQFGFEYTWEDLRPIKPLFVTMLVFQVIGAIIGLIVIHHPTWFENLWAGGAFGTSPGFLMGLYIQSKTRKEAISENIIMVRRLGMIALIFTLVTFLMPFK